MPCKQQVKQMPVKNSFFKFRFVFRTEHDIPLPPQGLLRMFGASLPPIVPRPSFLQPNVPDFQVTITNMRQTKGGRKRGKSGRKGKNKAASPTSTTLSCTGGQVSNASAIQTRLQQENGRSTVSNKNREKYVTNMLVLYYLQIQTLKVTPPISDTLFFLRCFHQESNHIVFTIYLIFPFRCNF